MARLPTWMRWSVPTLILLLLAGTGLVVLWHKLLSTKEQVLSSDQERFDYGSLGAERIAGIPYPIFMTLPRVFPDLIAQYATLGYGADKAAFGGYGAFGLAWEQGQPLPIGLSIRQVGYPRVTANCALCHTTRYRMNANDDWHFASGGPAHTANVQGLLRFLFAASHDSRFTAARLMPEIALNFPLDWVDWALYSFVLIPNVRSDLVSLEARLGWVSDTAVSGPGRIDAINWPKFILLHQPWDGSAGDTDFPAVWELDDREGKRLLAGGEARGAAAVTDLSAITSGSPSGDDVKARDDWFLAYLRGLRPQKFPGTSDPGQAALGKQIFLAQCASCHAPDGARTGTVIPLAEIGTDQERAQGWSQSDAAQMNRAIAALGFGDADFQAAQGYLARPLTGVWLLSPYLHNGSVPTLADLLSPPADRPAVIFRGYDVIDTDGVGFIATGDMAEANGFPLDTHVKGNANSGHIYGTTLTAPEKHALIEYLKTL